MSDFENQLKEKKKLTKEVLAINGQQIRETNAAKEKDA